MVESSTIAHPIEFQIYTQNTKSHSREFAIFDGSVGEVEDRPHLHFLVLREDCGERSIYSVVTIQDACRWPAFYGRIRAVLPGLLSEPIAEHSVLTRRRPRIRVYHDEDEEDSEMYIPGRFLLPVGANDLNVVACF
jgi:hypothetical protein